MGSRIRVRTYYSRFAERVEGSGILSGSEANTPCGHAGREERDGAYRAGNDDEGDDDDNLT